MNRAGRAYGETHWWGARGAPTPLILELRGFEALGPRSSGALEPWSPGALELRGSRVEIETVNAAVVAVVAVVVVVSIVVVAAAAVGVMQDTVSSSSHRLTT